MPFVAWTTRSRFLMPSFSTAIRCRRLIRPHRAAASQAFFFSSTGIAVTYSSFCCRPAEWSSSAGPSGRGTAPTRWTNNSAWRSASHSSTYFAVLPSICTTGVPGLSPRGDGDPAAALRRFAVAAVNTCRATSLALFGPAGALKSGGCQAGLRLGSQSQAGRRVPAGQHQGARSSRRHADRDHPRSERQEAPSLSGDPTQRARAGRQGKASSSSIPLAHPGRINGFLRLTPKAGCLWGRGMSSSRRYSTIRLRSTRSTWSSSTAATLWSFAI
jgi:hypothetical protein